MEEEEEERVHREGGLALLIDWGEAWAWVERELHMIGVLENFAKDWWGGDVHATLCLFRPQ